MGIFYNRVVIKSDVANGTRVYLDGEELKKVKSASLEIAENAPPVLTVSMLVDKVDIETDSSVGLRLHEENEP